jgi:DNA-binding LytR/AlgR family response regulator
LKDVACLDGLQVHRSCWVKRSAVVKLTEDNGATSLELVGGVRIPVSRAYQKVVQQAGWA